MRRGASQQLVTKYTSTKLYFSNDKTMLPKDPNTELYFINVKTFTVDLAEQKSSDFITISNWRLHCVPQHNNNQHHSSVLSIHLLQNLKTVRFLLWIWIWKRLWYALVWITAKVLPHMFDYLREGTTHMSTCVFEKDCVFEYLRKTRWRRRRRRRGGSDRWEGALVSVGRSHRISQSPLGDHWPNWVMEKRWKHLMCVCLNFATRFTMVCPGDAFQPNLKQNLLQYDLYFHSPLALRGAANASW